jgi:Trypsin
VVVALAAAAPSGAVVGGEPVAHESVPWFADVAGCGGMLVAPDRVLTAGHCVMNVPLSNIAGVLVGTEQRHGTRFALHPGWRHANGPHNVLDDVALVQVDVPVTDVAPVALGGGAPGGETWILGRGRQLAQGTGHKTATLTAGGLRQAVLRRMSNKDCAATWKHRRGNGGERFDAARMLCAIDVDGQEPLSSGCNGDSGGPLYTGSACGAGAARRRQLGQHALRRRRHPVRVRGRRALPGLHHRSGAHLGAVAHLGGEGQRLAPRRRQAHLRGRRQHRAADQGRGAMAASGRAQAQGRRARADLQGPKADAGHPLVCSVTASNDGGASTAPFAPTSMAKIPR